MNAIDEAAGQQQPGAGALNLDHVAHFVPDADAASTALEKLGFTLTPFSLQQQRDQGAAATVAAGTGNRCVMLRRGYLEFLTPVADTPLAAQLRAAIARYIGVHLIAFGTAAPAADHARLVANGFEPLPVIDLQRSIATPAGEDTARFAVVRVPPGRMAEGRIQYCQQRTPELVWQPRWIVHANRAGGLAAVIVCVADAQETARRYHAFTGIAPRREGAAWRLDLERGAVLIAHAEAVARYFDVTPPALPWIAGYVLDCDDLAQAHACARAANCRIVEPDASRIVVAAPAAVGGMIVFQSLQAPAFALA